MSMEDEFIDGADQPPAEAHAREVAAEQVRVDQEHRALKTAYARMFATGNPTAGDRELVLRDLMTFGRVFNTTAPMPGDRTPTWPLEILEGRRQVALRIMEYANLPIDVLFHRYWNR